MQHALAVKAFITKDGKILLVRRSKKDEWHPEIWEPVGGRLEKGESIVEGLKRELKEEIGIDVEPLFPIRVHHFIDNKGTKIHMITFLCKYKGGEIRLNEELEEYKWIDVKEAEEYLYFRFWEDLGRIKVWFSDIVK